MSKDKIGEHSAEECATCAVYHKEHRYERLSKVVQDILMRHGYYLTGSEAYEVTEQLSGIFGKEG